MFCLFQAKTSTEHYNHIPVRHTYDDIAIMTSEKKYYNMLVCYTSQATELGFRSLVQQTKERLMTSWGTLIKVMEVHLLLHQIKGHQWQFSCKKGGHCTGWQIQKGDYFGVKLQKIWAILTLFWNFCCDLQNLMILMEILIEKANIGGHWVWTCEKGGIQ